MATLPILVAVVATTLFGDYFLKLASSHETGISSQHLFIGAVLYGLSAVGWFLLMQSHSLATIGVIYSASTTILLAMLGAVVFKEPLGYQQALGISLAIASVAVIYNYQD